MAYARSTVRRAFCARAVGGLMLVLTLGCGNSGSSSESVRKPIDSAPRTEYDPSLEPEEYIRRGLPAPDRVWTGADMVQANKVLASFTNEGAAQLPRCNSPRSREVFARLTSIESFPSFRNRDVPIETRLKQSADYGDGLKEIMKRYTYAFLNHKVGDAEVVEMMGAVLRHMVVTLELLDEFVPTLDENDPTYAVRMRGLERVRLGLGELVTGVLIMLTERDQYSHPQLVRLLDYIQETVPLIAPRLSPDVASETVDRLQRIQQDQRMKGLQPGLGVLLWKVQDALAKRKAPG